jgi:hypothetical protein
VPAKQTSIDTKIKLESEMGLVLLEVYWNKAKLSKAGSSIIIGNKYQRLEI